ncbi:capsular exopolysaccharide family [Geodermatophilus pulveris]|uniref:non-specific protein-tyrosine kinase n=1 Tax=Geodermatophilus pulveris TaxID=1564159 RepID=A0A239GWK7_9ACTN|nr:polysaccharide biosynthesis tyrosine autokinase [Geodermatophilus pulveris]SNS73331.1 capsular exopolysaccharide family [Geodermatophilus pulveris]
MSLNQFLTVLRRRIRWVLSVFVLCLVAAVVLSAFLPRRYEATAELYVSVTTAESVDDLAQGARFTREQMASFASLALTPRVLEPVAERFDVSSGAQGLERRVSVQASDTTVVIELTVADADPDRAADLANAVATRTIDVVEDLAPESPVGGDSAVRVTVVRPATAPESAASPNTVLNVAAGTVLGLSLGILLALAREALDTRVRDADVLAQLTPLPMLGRVASWSERQGRVLVATAPHSPAAESIRQLRTNLQFLRVARDPAGAGRAGAEVVSVTSALSGEGKSTVSANLAVALAQTGARVLLVDADLRRPTVADVLRIEGGVGLTTVLAGDAGLADVVQEWGAAGLHVLPSGALPPNPTELLASPAMRWLVDQLRQAYDYVVVDTSPLLPVADASVLAGLVDGTVVVANVTRVRRAQLRQALGNLEQVSARVFGVVLNQVRRDEEPYSYRQWDTARGTAPAAAAAAGS